MASRLERLLRMEHQIRKGAYPNVDTFCQMFDVRPRSIYQDLRMLRREAGLGIVFDRVRNGYYIVNPEKTLPAFELTEDELLSLALSKEMLSSLTQRAVEPLIEGALDKIIDRNNKKAGQRLCSSERFVSVMDTSHSTASFRVILQLFKAWTERRAVTVCYSLHKGEPGITGTMEPRSLVLKGGLWYLVAYCRCSRALRALPAWTISGVTVTRDICTGGNERDTDAFVDLLFSSGQALKIG